MGAGENPMGRPCMASDRIEKQALGQGRKEGGVANGLCGQEWAKEEDGQSQDKE